MSSDSRSGKGARPTAKELLRWLLAVAAVPVAFLLMIELHVLFLHFGSYPKDLAQPTAGFTLALAVVLAGALAAPRARFLVALALWMVVTEFSFLLLDVHLPGLLLGGGVAVAVVAWWVAPRRSAWVTRWGIVSLGVASVAAAGFVIARMTDWPARPDPLPPFLATVLGPDAARVREFHRYDLGGFLDHQQLWRLEVDDQAVVVSLVRGLGLQPTDTVPRSFWRMPPLAWARRMPEAGRAYSSPGFTAEDRGPDGVHYFLVSDLGRDRVLVWEKDNF
jgi:hypothetical protein